MAFTPRMNRPQVIYVANMRLPSEKAHSVHVMRMCAALGQMADVTLVIPDRATHIRTEDVHAYYGVEKTFDIIRLKTWDAFRLRLPSRLAFYAHAWTFGRAVYRLSRAHPDAIFLCRDLYAAYRLARSGRRTAYEIHDLPQQRVKWYVRSIGRIVTTNDFKKEALCTVFGLPSERVLVAPNAVNPEVYRQPHPAHLRKKLSLLDDTPLVVYVGHAFAWKGVDTLVRAALLLADTPVHIVVVGGLSEDQARLKTIIAEERIQNVHLLSQQPPHTIPGILADATICVLPTSAKTSQAEETSPMKAFEYLAAEKPIVASDVPSSRDILTSETAVFFRPDDPVDCARAIHEALAISQDASRLTVMQAAQRVAIAGHTWQARARSVLDFLHT